LIAARLTAIKVSAAELTCSASVTSKAPEASVNDEFTIFSGTANPNLAKSIARELNTPLGTCVVDRYPDGDVAVQLLESVRRKEVFLVQPTAPQVNDKLVELLALAAARGQRASPQSCHTSATVGPTSVMAGASRS
jgi:hypothetical protein